MAWRFESVRRRPPVVMFARIVAAVDAGPAGLRALEVATEMAARFRCGLVLVTVLPWKDGDGDPELERLVPMDAEGRTLHRVLEEGAVRARQRGVPDCSVAFLRGPVVEVLLEYLRSTPPDLVVVGTRGLSRGSRLLLGSVSSRLVTEAPCPVLVARAVAKAVRRSPTVLEAGSSPPPRPKEPGPPRGGR